MQRRRFRFLLEYNFDAIFGKEIHKSFLLLFQI